MSRDTSWGKVADWYKKVVKDEDSYQQKVLLPNLIRIIEPTKGKMILDLACGEGFFTTACATKGARAFGADISPELIALAKKHATHNEEFIVTPADDLAVFPAKYFDAVSIVLAIQNIENFSKVFKEVARIIKPQGKFVIVLNHPAFRIPDKTSWGFDEQSKSQYRMVFEYMAESRKAIDMNPGKTAKGAPPELTHSFHRPIQAYSKSLANAGFAIHRIEEWISHKESEPGPKKSAEDKARREIPMFMCLECIKL